MLDNALHFSAFPAKTFDSMFCKSPKTLFLGHFWPKSPNLGRTRIFPKNLALSFFFPYGPLTSCKKSEKSFEPIHRTCVADGRTDVILLNRSAQRVAYQYRLVSYFSHDNISFQSTTSLKLNVRNLSCISILFQYICFKSIRIPFSEFKKMDKMT